jgi:hypothetical protein
MKGMGVASGVINRERVKLLFGPYEAPRLKRGDRAFCLYRDCAVRIATWSDARIPWPRCYYADGRARAYGLLVNDVLLNAIKHESGAALMHWWGVSRNTVGRWRGVFGVGRKDNEGTHRLVFGAIQATLDVRRSEGRVWTEDEMALVGALPDSEVARRTGRTLNAVRLRRHLLGRPRIGAPRRLLQP